MGIGSFRLKQLQLWRFMKNVLLMKLFKLILLIADLLEISDLVQWFYSHNLIDFFNQFPSM